MALIDLVGFTTSTTGTGTVTVGSAVQGLRTLSGASIADGTQVSYSITTGAAGSEQYETGTGTVGGSGTTLTRTLRASSTGSLLSLSGTSKVYVSVNAIDLQGGSNQGIFGVSQYSYFSGANYLGAVATRINFSSAEGVGSGGSAAEKGPSGGATLVERMACRRLISGSTANNYAAFYVNDSIGNRLRRGTGTTGGFRFVTVFSFDDPAPVSTAKAFIGLGNSRFPNDDTDPATYINVIGIGQIAGDSTQLYVIYGGTAPQTPIALGTSGFGINPAHVYKFVLEAPPTGEVFWTAINLSTGDEARGALTGGTAVLPPSTMDLNICGKRSNGSTAAVVRLNNYTLYGGMWT